MKTTEEVLDELAGLESEGFEPHIIINAWYSAHAITNAVGGDTKGIPKVSCVRFRTPGRGMVEIHPTPEGLYEFKCYCCFGGDIGKGTVAFDAIRSHALSLKEHECPPWPG